MERKAIWGIMLTLLLINLLTLAFKIQPGKASGTIYFRTDGSTNNASAQGTKVSVINPSTGDLNFRFFTNTTSVGDTFIANITVTDVIDLWAWQILLYFNVTMLNITSTSDVFLPPDHVFAGKKLAWPLLVVIDYAEGYVQCGAVLSFDETSFDGSGRLAQIRFTIIKAPPIGGKVFSNLEIDNVDTFLWNSDLNDISTEKIGGYYEFNSLPVHNIDTLLDYATIQEAINAQETLNGHTIKADAGTYYEHVVVNKSLTLLGENRSTTIIDGDGEGIVIHVTADNVVISGFTVQRGLWGILLDSSSSNTVSGNTAANNNANGIQLVSSSYSNVSGNTATNNVNGIHLYLSSNNTVSGNIAVNNIKGIFLSSSSNNTLSGNSATNNAQEGILLFNSGNNTVSGNTAEKNTRGIVVWGSSNNSIYHNNFINNTLYQAYSFLSSSIWDNGYPSGGNYWSDYNGTDLYIGPYQNVSGSDGIGDIPYVIDADNQDNYPLMEPYPSIHAVAVKNVRPIKTLIGQGFTTEIHVDVTNQGHFIETFSVTIYANTTIIQTENIILSGGNSTTVTFMWNTTAWAKGNYTISAVADIVPGEVDTTDNAFTDGWVIVAMVGDVSGLDGWPDGKVNIMDLTAIAKIYGVNHPDPRYNANYDLNDDGKINIADLTSAAKHFGETDP